jgi:hypothetical protein
MTRHWLSLILVVLAIMCVRRGASLASQRDESRKLSAQLATLTASSNGGITTTSELAKADAAELQALRDNAFRVHQLRGEVTLAQQRFDNLAPLVTNLAAKLTARTNQVETGPAPEFPPGYFPRHELTDRGNATPEAALETFWWAMSHGNLPKLFAVSVEMAGQPVPENPNREDDGFTYMFRAFPGYQVVKRENGAAGRLVMGLRTAPGARVVDMILVHTNGQWLVSIESLQKAFNDSSR